MKKKFRGFYIKRIDKTVEPDPKTGKYESKWFNCRVNNAVPPDHRMIREK